MNAVGQQDAEPNENPLRDSGEVLKSGIAISPKGSVSINHLARGEHGGIVPYLGVGNNVVAALGPIVRNIGIDLISFNTTEVAQAKLQYTVIVEVNTIDISPFCSGYCDVASANMSVDNL